MDENLLENPIWSSLTGPHRALGEGTGRARRYRPEFSTFGSLRDPDDDQAWADLAALTGSGRPVALASTALVVRPGWTVAMTLDGLQMVATDAFEGAPDSHAVLLGVPDVAAMTDLVARTNPGPFEHQTWRMGTYLGLREQGRLVAMAGERLHPEGWCELSAICTDPGLRGRGLATRLVRAVGDGIVRRGEQPFLHVLAANTTAVRLYEHLGFAVRRSLTFLVLRAP